MPTTGDVAQIVISIAGGMGGAQLLRAWGQNRNERTTTLTGEQKAFRTDLMHRNGVLTGRMDTIDAHNSELVIANAEFRNKIEIQALHIEAMGDRLTLLYNERETLKKLVEKLEFKALAQEQEIANLHKELATLRRPDITTETVIQAQKDNTRATDELKESTDELKVSTDAATLVVKTQIGIQKADEVKP